MKSIKNKELLKCRFSNGMMMLPFYHCTIIWNLSYTYWVIESFRVSKLKTIIRLIKAIPYCGLKKCDILFFSNTVHEFVIDGKYRNKLIGDYYEMYPDRSMIIEGAGRDMRWRTKDSYPNLSLISTPLLYLCRFLASLANVVKPKNNPDFDLFLREYPSFFTKAGMGKSDYFVIFYAYFIKKLLAYVSPRLLFLEDASYGVENSIICKVAHNLGIKVIEPQHGTVVEHAAYFSSSFIPPKSEYYEYLPDCIFTFGKYWEQYIHWDYEKYTVGNSYLNNYIQYSPKHPPLYDFLVISQGLEDKYRLDFILKLSSLFNDSKILMRLHPEEDYDKNVKQFAKCKNIIFSHGTTLYDDISNSKEIIGWNSTCLIEALAFGKNPFIVDCLISRKHFPNDIGRWIKEPNELLSCSSVDNSNNVDVTYYWADNFKSNISSYIDKYLI